MDLLKGLRHLWLIRVRINLKVYNTGKITPEYLFAKVYTEKIHESEQVRTSNKKLRVLLDSKYEMADLNKARKTNANICKNYNVMNC